MAGEEHNNSSDGSGEENISDDIMLDFYDKTNTSEWNWPGNQTDQDSVVDSVGAPDTLERPATPLPGTTIEEVAIREQEDDQHRNTAECSTAGEVDAISVERRPPPPPAFRRPFGAHEAGSYTWPLLRRPASSTNQPARPPPVYLSFTTDDDTEPIRRSMSLPASLSQLHPYVDVDFFLFRGSGIH